MEECRFRVDRCKKKLKNVEKVGMFFVGGFSGRFQPHFHHNSTTIYHAIHHVLHIKKRETPLQNATFTTREKNYKI